MDTLHADLLLTAPELLMAVGGMVVLMFGVFAAQKRPGIVNALAIVLFAATAFLIWRQPAGVLATAFAEAFVVNDFTRFAKLLVLLGAALSILISTRFFEREKIARFEFAPLMIFATLGMLMMISAGGLISLYVGLELQSLALYVLAAFNRDSVKATEAGLKYFVLGALSSCLLLYGSSLIYGFAGTVQFDGIQVVVDGGRNLGVLIGIVFILAGLAFKVSAVPFHMWTPDVYEGAPTPVTAFFAGAPKVAAIALLLRVLFDALPHAAADWRQIVTFISIASMALGAFAAIGQTNIKRLMAYSSIGNIGYALVGVAAGTEQGISSVLIFMAIYVVMTAGVFVCILAMRRVDGPTEKIEDLSGLMGSRPLLALCWIILLFSYVGLPPLPGFFGKYYVFGAAVEQGMWPLAVIGILTSVVAAYYYVRIVMLIINGAPPEKPFEPTMGGELRVVLGGTMLFSAAMIIVPGILVGWAGIAAAALIK
ncbi:NADH-quinone oxidoreductase subunit N [Alphaproteobacteria bacterium SO-S41]|nr:NADH-quinone oxidoreductase subunit N [Alphaproteobacteria bacterium SO-S41]